MERGLLNLINYGDRERFHHVIICLTDAGAFAKLLVSPNCSVVELHKKDGNDWRLPRRIADVALREKLHVLHARGWPTMVESLVGARLARVPATLYTFHGKTFEDLQGIGFKRRWIQSLIIRCYQRIITLNQNMRKDLGAECYLPESMIGIIANGVDVDAFKPREDKRRLRASFNLPVDRFIVGNVARLDPVKNHEILLRAMRQVIDQGLKPYLLMVGDGPNRVALERQIKKSGLDSEVRIFGFSNQVAELLGCMDIYVQSSFYEGFSNTVLEAMACGLSVLATNVGGTGELMNAGEQGFFFAPDDDHSLASLITRLYRDQEQRRLLGVRARAHVLEHFRIQSMVERYEATYLEMVERSRDVEAV